MSWHTRISERWQALTGGGSIRHAVNWRTAAAVLGACAIVLALVLGSPSLWSSTTTTTTAAGPSASDLAPAGTTEPESPGATSTAPSGSHTSSRAGTSHAAQPTAQSSSSYSKTGGDTSITDPTGGLSSGPSGPRQVPTGKGVGATTASIGIAYDINGSAYAAAYGTKVPNVDQKAQAKGVVDYINAHGGVGGRKIVPVWHAVDLAASLRGSNEGQKTCDAFTQDSTVFAAIGDVQSECLLKAGVVEINEAINDPSEFTQYPNYLYAPSAFDEAGAEQATALGLKASGFFDAMPANPGCNPNGRKVGAIIFDVSKSAVEPLVTSAYQQVGVTISDWGLVASDSSNVQQIILQFKQDCVTHIITPEYSPLLVAQAAEAQQYRPLWGIGSNQSPQLLQSNLNANQLANMYGSGWSPGADMDDAHDPGPLGPDARLCTSIMRAQGLPTDRASMAIVYPICDELFVIKAVFDHAAALTPAGFRAAYEAIGSWDSPLTFVARLGPGHHSGADGFRPMRVVHGAWTYTGSVHTL